MRIIGFEFDDKHFQKDRLKPAFTAFIVAGAAAAASNRALDAWGLGLNLLAQTAVFFVNLAFFLATMYVAAIIFGDDKKK